MYAIIRAGGKQAKVSEGDVIAIERIKTADAEVTFTPLLIVQDDGTVISERAALDKAKVVAEVLGESRGDKVEVFKYKNKSGYRRRQGHRQTYTSIQVTAIETGAKKAAKKSKKKAASEDKAPEEAAKAPKEKAKTEPKAEAPAAETAAGDEEA
jgi:large subunit ribosomal protein L21